MAFEQLIINALNYLQTFIFTNGAASLGWRFFGFFVVCNAAGAATFSKFYPETRGLSLEEITLLYVDERGPVKASLDFQKAQQSLSSGKL